MQFMEIWDELPLRSGTIKLKSGGLTRLSLSITLAELAPTLREHMELQSMSASLNAAIGFPLSFAP